jgi:hypothetical protein
LSVGAEVRGDAAGQGAVLASGESERGH